MFGKIIVSALAIASVSASPAPAVKVARDQVEKRDSGVATFFDTGLGACGWWNNPEDSIVALNSCQFDGGSHCGQWLGIYNPGTGNTEYAYVADECPSCDCGSLDMTTGLWGKLANWNYDAGVFNMDWWWSN